MPPRSSLPRLTDINPTELGAETARRAIDHLHSLSMRIDVGRIEVRVPEGPTTLEYTTRQLAHYAQTGDGGDWSDDPVGCVHDALIEVCSALYSTAADPGFGGGVLDLPDDVDASDELGVVLLAATARSKLHQRGAGLTPRELGALAGVDPGHVRLLARRDELKIEDGIVPRTEARRWLSGRGVPGVTTK